MILDRISAYKKGDFYIRWCLGFLLFFLSITLPVAGQISEPLYAVIPDSLKPLNRMKPTMKEQGKILFYSSFFEERDEVGELEDMAHRYIQETAKIQEDKKKLNAYDNLCTYFLNKGSFDTALQYCNLIIDVLSPIALKDFLYKKNLIMYKGIKGYLLSFSMKYEESILLLNECERFYSAQNDSLGIVDANMYLANVYMQLEMYEDAVRCQEQSLAYLKKNFAWNTSQLQIRSDIATTYLYLYTSKKDTAYGVKAEKIINELLKVKDKDGIELLSYTYALKSWISLLNKDYALAMSYSDSTLAGEDYFLSNKNFNELVATLSSGYALMYTGQPQKGITRLKEAIRNHDATEDNNKTNLLYDEALLTIYNYEKQQKHWEEALRYFEKLKERSDQASLLHNRVVMFKINQEYDVAAKENQIKILAYENHRQRNNLLSGIFASLLLIVILSILLRNRQRRLQHEKKMTEQTVEKERLLRQQELVKLETTMLRQQNNAVLAQRKQISEDMHDDLSSSLAGLKFYITDIKTTAVYPESKKLLGNIEMEVETIYKNARQYIHSLHNSAQQYQYDLAGYLHELNNEVFDKTSFSVDVIYDAPAIHERLNATQQQHLYYIIRESITNTIKHSKATGVIVRLEMQARHCLLTINDNGIGFKAPVAEAITGLGLQSISKRAKDMEGTFNIQSGINGTCIIIRFKI